MIKNPKSAQKPSYKEEIRHSMIKNALFPVLIIGALIIFLLYAIWFFNIFKTIKSDNENACSIIENSVGNYASFLGKEFDESFIVEMENDRTALNRQYNSFMRFVKEQPLKANFFVIDKDYDVTMQSRYPANFKLTNEQITKEWSTFGKIKKNPHKTIIEMSGEFNSSLTQYEIVIGKTILVKGKVIGYIVFSINESEIRNSILSSSSDFVLTNENDSVLTSTNAFYSKWLKNNSLDGKNTAMIEDVAIQKSTLQNLDFNVYTFSSLAQLRLSFLTSIIVVILLFGVATLGAMYTSTKLSEQKTKNVDEVVMAFNEIKKGNLDFRLDGFETADFDTIASAYNKMLDDFENLIEINSQKTKQNFLSEIKQLEMQLNPHFLFNTLENIRYSISFDPEGAKSMVVNLSEILRYSINGVQEITFGEDIEYLQCYLKIIKARFKNNFEYKFDISEKANNIIIPKLILQPLIENSVKYGYGEKEVLSISIKAKVVDDELKIEIADNGVGIEKGKLEEINDMLQKKTNNSEHIGLYNVNRRLQLLYGEKYGLKIFSKTGFGTTIKLVMGIKKND
ncbi:MAG: histidine kinase [Clostridia bacterium]